VGTGSEAFPGAFVFLLVRGFLVTPTVEGESSVTGEGGWAVDVDGGSYRRVFHELMFLQTEGCKHTCTVAGGGNTVDKSRTTVFFRLPVFDDSAGGGFAAPGGSVGGSTHRSAESAGVESLWLAPGFCFLFPFCFWGTTD
jgi:hypothetical protein